VTDQGRNTAAAVRYSVLWCKTGEPEEIRAPGQLRILGIDGACFTGLCLDMAKYASHNDRSTFVSPRQVESGFPGTITGHIPSWSQGSTD